MQNTFCWGAPRAPSRKPLKQEGKYQQQQNATDPYCLFFSLKLLRTSLNALVFSSRFNSLAAEIDLFYTCLHSCVSF